MVTNPGVGNMAPGSGGTSPAVSQLEQLMSFAGVSGTVAPAPTAETQVYMGPAYNQKSPVQKTTTPVAGAFDPHGKGPLVTTTTPSNPVPTYYGQSHAKGKLYSMSQAELNDVITYGGIAFNTDLTHDVGNRATVWNAAVDGAIAYKNTTGKDISPWEWLKQQAALVTPDPNKNGGAGTGTRASTSVNLANPDEAHAYLTDALKRHLGRAPTPFETQNFMTALQAHQQANPTVSTPTDTRDAQGNITSTSTVTTGGTYPQDFADQYAGAQEGAAEYTAATSGVSTLLKAIMNPIVPNA